MSAGLQRAHKLSHSDMKRGVYSNVTAGPPPGKLDGLELPIIRRGGLEVPSDDEEEAHANGEARMATEDHGRDEYAQDAHPFFSKRRTWSNIARWQRMRRQHPVVWCITDCIGSFFPFHRWPGSAQCWVACLCLTNCLLVTAVLLATAWHYEPQIAHELGLNTHENCATTSKFECCNWVATYGESTITKDERLPISAGNRFFVDPASAVGRDAMHQLVDRVRTASREDADEHICDIFDDNIDGVGLNGLVDFLLIAANDGSKASTKMAESWGLPSSTGATFHPEMSDAAHSWRHVVGAYAVDKAVPKAPLPAHAPGGSAVKEGPAQSSTYRPLTMTTSSGNLLILRDILEIVASLELEGAPLHAATWQAMLGLSTADPGRQWSFAMDNFCGDLRLSSPDLFVHCLHGFGHGTIAVGSLMTMSTEQRRQYDTMGRCERIRHGASLVVSPAMMDVAMRICNYKGELNVDGATAAAAGTGHFVTEQMRYVCAGGLYMQFWDAPPPPPPELPSYRQTCARYNYSAACYRFQHRNGAFKQLDRIVHADTDEPVPEPCTQSLWAESLSLTGRSLRGCIWGMAFMIYPVFDSWRYKLRDRDRVFSALRPSGPPVPTLRQYCSLYEPLRDPETGGPCARDQKCVGLPGEAIVAPIRVPNGDPAPPRVRSYGNWLACIAGAMAALAFQVDQYNIDAFVVTRHCEQIHDARGREVCIGMGMSRQLVNGSLLHIWQTDVLSVVEPIVRRG